MSCHAMSSQNAGNWVLFKKCSVHTVHLKQQASTCMGLHILGGVPQLLPARLFEREHATHFAWWVSWTGYQDTGASCLDPAKRSPVLGHISQRVLLWLSTSNIPPYGARNSWSQRDVSTWNPAVPYPPWPNVFRPLWMPLQTSSQAYLLGNRLHCWHGNP